MEFKDYLKQQNYTTHTIDTIHRESQHFKRWSKNKASVYLIDYKTCLKYIKYLQRKRNSKKTINHKIRSLKTFFNYLIAENHRIDNPFDSIRIKGVIRTTHYNLLEQDELLDSYYSYPTDAKDKHHKLTAKRDKAILGLLVFQGLNTRDIGLLTIDHLDLHQSKLYIPSTRRSNSRTLPLEATQMLGLLEYQTEIRPALIDYFNGTDKLFPLNCNRYAILTGQIIKKLKRINYKVESVKQIRASVITIWLKQYNLRKVQVMAGHRYISSTERYQQDDLENLIEMVNQFHPLQ
jgi:integrase/recombinase XerD